MSRPWPPHQPWIHPRWQPGPYPPPRPPWQRPPGPWQRPPGPWRPPQPPSNPATATVGVAAGWGAKVAIAGDDQHGQITLTTGLFAAISQGPLVNVTLGQAAAVKVTQVSGLSLDVTATPTADGFEIQIATGGRNPVGFTTYGFSYSAVED